MIGQCRHEFVQSGRVVEKLDPSTHVGDRVVPGRHDLAGSAFPAYQDGET